MKSYYELKENEIKEYEQAFLKLKEGAKAHQIWVTNNIMGVLLSIVSVLFLFVSYVRGNDMTVMDLLFCIFLVLGILIVYSSSREYYDKYDSWLEVSKKVIRRK